MTVNNGGKLSKEYFIAYLGLIMNARTFSLEEAQEYMIRHYFNNNLHSFGEYSHLSYLKAVEELGKEREDFTVMLHKTSGNGTKR